MITAYDSSLSGMRASQTMLDVTANNLANTVTNGFKSSRTDFADTFYRTDAGAQSPRGTIGGVNSDQVGQGVAVSTIINNMGQGAINATGRDLDMAITGDGFFRLQQVNGNEVYTRVGNFAFDSGQAGGVPNLVDIATGNRVLNTLGQPITRVDRMAANATSELTLGGNLPPEAFRPLHGDRLSSLFRVERSDDRSAATVSTPLSETTLARAPHNAPVTVNVFGTQPDGTAFAGAMTLNPGATMGDVVSELNQVLSSGSTSFATASIENGQVVIKAASTGAELGVFLGETAPPAARDDASANAWQHTAGGVYDWNLVRQVPDAVSTDLKLFTADGTQHTVGARFFNAGVDAAGNRTWDLVAGQPIGGTVTNGVVRGYTFSATGNLVSDPGGTLDTTWEVGGASTVSYAVGQLSGFAGDGLVDAQDGTGYAAGFLTGTKVDDQGNILGTYSNGRTQAMSATGHQIGLAVFANRAGLDRLGESLWDVSPNSGDPVYVAPGAEGSNAITGSALEGSNVDMASEYVRLILAQRSFQSNSKAFQVADELIQTANGLVR
jgi:flagellar hook protein FlgE